MTSPDDYFRMYYRSVTPAAFPPCPPTPVETATTTVPATRSLSGARRAMIANRTALAIAASLFLCLAFFFSPSTPDVKTVDNSPNLLDNATANGKSLQPRAKPPATPK